MSAPKPKFALTHEEKTSKLWRKLLAHWEDKLETLRNQNDGDKSEIDTAKLRGRISECKANLSLDKDAPDID